jgi:predicted amidophosphoribosyltransferase
LSTTGFEDLFKELVPARKKLVVEWPIESRETVTAAHSGGSRDPVEIMDNFDWTGFENEEPETLVVIDDVLTTGSHFRAFCDFIR